MRDLLAAAPTRPIRVLGQACLPSAWASTRSSPRDRRRSAWCGDGASGLRPAFGPQVPGLHGGQVATPEAQRISHGSADRCHRDPGALHQHLKMPATRRCATGLPTVKPPTTCSGTAAVYPSPLSCGVPEDDRGRGQGPVLREEERLPDAVIACVGGGSECHRHVRGTDYRLTPKYALSVRAGDSGVGVPLVAGAIFGVIPLLHRGNSQSFRSSTGSLANNFPLSPHGLVCRYWSLKPLASPRQLMPWKLAAPVTPPVQLFNFVYALVLASHNRWRLYHDPRPATRRTISSNFNPVCSVRTGPSAISRLTAPMVSTVATASLTHLFTPDVFVPAS